MKYESQKSIILIYMIQPEVKSSPRKGFSPNWRFTEPPPLPPKTTKKLLFNNVFLDDLEQKEKN